MLYGELVYATNLDRASFVADPVAAARDLRELGFYVGADAGADPWAAIGVRYDRYDPDRDANDLRGGVQVPRDSSYSTLVGRRGAALSPATAGCILEYDHNTNALGRTPTARRRRWPTTRSRCAARWRSDARARLCVTVVVARLAAAPAPTDDPGLDALLRVDGRAVLSRRAARGDRRSGDLVVHATPPASSARASRARRCRASSRATPPRSPSTSKAIAATGSSRPAPSDADRARSAHLRRAPVVLAAALPAGSYTLVGRAADARGHFGPPTRTALMTDDATRRRHARRRAHLGHRGRSRSAPGRCPTAPRSGPTTSTRSCRRRRATPADPNAFKSGGILDFDSNANCVIDGRRAENVFWTRGAAVGPLPGARRHLLAVRRGRRRTGSSRSRCDGAALGRAVRRRVATAMPL